MSSTFAKLLIAVCLTVTLASCGNTIRGMGRDAANTVDATQDAAGTVDNAAQ